MPDHSRLQSAILTTLSYSALFSHPLTAREVFHWLPILASQRDVDLQLSRLLGEKKIKRESLFYFTPEKIGFATIRRQREKISQKKQPIALATAKKLSFIPWIQTVAVTGSLAMNNCIDNADVDLMIICLPNTLWFTRFFVWFLLFPNRRSPRTRVISQVKNKICDNVYLESNNLGFDPPLADIKHSFYLAHEILQAKPIVDRHQTFKRLISQNQWLENVLPHAYHSYHPASIPPKEKNQPLSYLLLIPNLLSFLCQYLFMKRRLTNESISLHRALFHPKLPPRVASFSLPTKPVRSFA